MYLAYESNYYIYIIILIFLLHLAYTLSDPCVQMYKVYSVFGYRCNCKTERLKLNSILGLYSIVLAPIVHVCTVLQFLISLLLLHF